MRILLTGRAVRLDQAHKAKTTKRDQKSTPISPWRGGSTHEKFDTLIAAEALQIELDAKKERADRVEFSNPDDYDDDPDEEAPDRR